MGVAMKFKAWLQQEFYRSVISSPKALAWFQNLYWSIEAYGEVPELEDLTDRLGDSWIERNLTKHLADERRHAELWHTLLSQRGAFQPEQLPPWANTVQAFDEAGWLGVLARIQRQEPVEMVELIPFFAALHVLEVDGVERFMIFADAAADLDPETTQVLRSIIKDEQFHVYYTGEALHRLGEKLGCPEYAEACLKAAQQAYEQRLWTANPLYLSAVQAQGARFTTTFMTISNLLQWIAGVTGVIQDSVALPAPPTAPRLPNAA